MCNNSENIKYLILYVLKTTGNVTMIADSKSKHVWNNIINAFA